MRRCAVGRQISGSRDCQLSDKKTSRCSSLCEAAGIDGIIPLTWAGTPANRCDKDRLLLQGVGFYGLSLLCPPPRITRSDADLSPHTVPERVESTYRGRDSPASHARDLEAALLHLLTGQLDVEVELVVAGADNHLTALLREVGDAGVKLDVAVILQGLTQMDELGLKRINEK